MAAIAEMPALAGNQQAAVMAPIAGIEAAVKMVAMNRFLERQPNLETQFAPRAFQALNVRAECEMMDYLAPNEMTLRRIMPHVARMEEGLAAFVGTERGFGGGALCPPEKCAGLMLVDSMRGQQLITGSI